MSHTWVTDMLAADELPLLQVAGIIRPVDVSSLIAREQHAIITIPIFKSCVVWLLVFFSDSPSGEVPGAAICPGPIALFNLVCSPNPDARRGLFLQFPKWILKISYIFLHVCARSHEYHWM